MPKPRHWGDAPAAPDITGPVRALPWADQALCAQVGDDLWFPKETMRYVAKPNGQRESAAKAICSRCPVMLDCRDYALAHPELEGIWGGYTQRERERVRNGREAS